MKKSERKLEISLTPDTSNGNETPYFYVVLEWSDKPCTLDGEIVPGSENGCWFNAGICGWTATPMSAFCEAFNRLRGK